MSTTTGPLGRAWASYRERVVPADASPVQVQECQRAFYMGAAALYYDLMNGLSEGPDTTQADEEYMAAVDRELRAFIAQVGITA